MVTKQPETTGEHSHVVTPTEPFAGYCAGCLKPEENAILIPKLWIVLENNGAGMVVMHKSCFVRMGEEAAAELSPAFRRRIIRAMRGADE